MALDDALRAGRLVTGDDDEPTRVRPHMRVLDRRHLNRRGTPHERAFASERHSLVLLTRPQPALDALVRLPEHRLVDSESPLTGRVHRPESTPLGPVAAAM